MNECPKVKLNSKINPTSYFFYIYSVPPDFRPVVYCQAIANDDGEKWDFMWESFLKEKDSQEKEVLLKALTCTRNASLAKRYLKTSNSRVTQSPKNAGSLYLREKK